MVSVQLRLPIYAMATWNCNVNFGKLISCTLFVKNITNQLWRWPQFKSSQRQLHIRVIWNEIHDALMMRQSFQLVWVNWFTSLTVAQENCDAFSYREYWTIKWSNDEDNTSAEIKLWAEKKQQKSCGSATRTGSFKGHLDYTFLCFYC